MAASIERVAKQFDPARLISGKSNCLRVTAVQGSFLARTHSLTTEL